MRLHKIIAKNYRSIRGDEDGEEVVFKGVDCLVGKNNAGKTNILSAVKFLLGESDKTLDEELFWNKETDREVVVKGIFAFKKNELNRLESSTRQKLDPFLTEGDGETLKIGVCRIVPSDSDGSTQNVKLVKSVPTEGDLEFSSFKTDHNTWWENATDSNHNDTKTDYRDNLQEEYPKVEEFVPEGKLTNKGSWFNAYLECIDNIKFQDKCSPTPIEMPKGVKDSVFNKLLPRPISIPAVREVESATQRSGELGELQKALSESLQDELDKEVQKELAALREHLTPQGEKDRFQPIEAIERRITEHLQETFSDREARLTFPKFTSEYVLRDMNLEIDETFLDSLSMKNVGEGVKRTLIFSLLRTLAELREGTLELDSDSEATISKNSNQRPLLILYEEADLFLHPQLQSTLMSAFNQLVSGNAQVIFSTHSPVMVKYDTKGDSENSADTINVVRKDDTTVVSQFHKALSELDRDEQTRLTQLQRISSYIFADAVLLVEGETDKIIFERLSSHLNSSWDFDSHDIPILEIGGKGDMPLFETVLTELGITPYMVLDRDAIPHTVSNLSLSKRCQDRLQDLQTTAEENLPKENSYKKYDYKEIEKKYKHMKEKAVKNLQLLHRSLEEGNEPAEEGIKCLETLIARQESKGEDSSKSPVARKMIDDDPLIQQERTKLLQALIEDVNLLVIDGTLEDYYPDSGHSVEAALNFEPSDYTEDELREYFTELPEQDITDIELFFDNIFGDKV